MRTERRKITGLQNKVIQGFKSCLHKSDRTENRRKCFQNHNQNNFCSENVKNFISQFYICIYIHTQ